MLRHVAQSAIAYAAPQLPGSCDAQTAPDGSAAHQVLGIRDAILTDGSAYRRLSVQDSLPGPMLLLLARAIMMTA